MRVQIINLEGEPSGARRIAMCFAAERARVASFNRNMAAAGMNFRMSLWKGLV